MRTSSRARSQLVGSLLMGFMSLVPALAQAEESDPGDVAHAIFIVGLIGILFLSCFSFGVWLLVVRLRSGKDAGSSRDKLPQSVDFERLWFPARSQEAPKLPPS